MSVDKTYTTSMYILIIIRFTEILFNYQFSSTLKVFGGVLIRIIYHILTYTSTIFFFKTMIHRFGSTNKFQTFRVHLLFYEFMVLYLEKQWSCQKKIISVTYTVMMQWSKSFEIRGKGKRLQSVSGQVLQYPTIQKSNEHHPEYAYS